jgi:hypothetical protein
MGKLRLVAPSALIPDTLDTPATLPNFAGDRSEIGGYRVIRTLWVDQSWLATAPGGRWVVLKTLDEDCLWKGQLHPNIKDRLARVRELAHSGVANLYGVERDGGLTYLVWEYVLGETLEAFTGSSQCGPRDFLLLARELVLNVEMLHARGIVHGALKASNVIANAEGRVVITHVSPLLYCEPSQDTKAVVGLLAELLEKRGEVDSPVARLLAETGEEVSLRRLAARLGSLIESRDSEAAPPDRGKGEGIRRRALMGAGATAVVGVALFLGLKQYASAKTPAPPMPPQAAPAALQAAPSGESSSAAAAGSWSRRAAP